MQTSQFPIDSAGGSAKPPSAIDSLDVLGALRRRQWLIGSCFIMCVGMALLYQFTTVPKYRAELQIMVLQRDSSLPAAGVSDSSDVDGISLADNVLATHMQLFTSRRILKDAIERFGLGKLDSISSRIRSGQDPVKFLQDEIDVAAGGEGAARDANVLVARYADPSPEDCATVLNAVLASYQDFLGDSFANTSTDALKLLIKTRDELEDQIATAETKYVRFQSQAPVLWDGQKSTNIHQKRLEMLEEELASVRTRQSETKARLQVIEEQLGDRDTQTLNDIDSLALLSETETERLKLFLQITRGDIYSEEFQAAQPVRTATANAQYQELLSLMLREKSLLADFDAEHPSVQIVREKIQLIRDFVNTNSPDTEFQEPIKAMQPHEILAAYKKLLEHDIAELRTRRTQLESESKVELAKSQELFTFERGGEVLRDDIDRKKRAYDDVAQRLSELNLAKDYGGFLAEVIAPAETQTETYWPKLPIIVAIGSILGLCLGSALALLVDLGDTTFRNPDQLQQLLGTPIAAHIPLTSVGFRKRRSDGVDRTIFVMHESRSGAAEAIRHIRTSLFFDSRVHQSKVLSITSPIPGDGKSTAAGNVAASIANAGKSVLLIDADLRRPRMQDLFGIDREPGLSDVLTGYVEPLDAIVECKEISGLNLLPCGLIPPNPSELLNMKEFAELLAMARDRYDYVLIDTPPLLAVSDPGIVCEHVDGVIFVTRILKNGQSAVARAREILAELNSRLVCGVVVGESDYLEAVGSRKNDYAYGQYGKYTEYYTAVPKEDRKKLERRQQEII